MANPKPTAGQLGLIGGAIIGVGAAFGGIPYFRAVEKHKKDGG